VELDCSFSLAELGPRKKRQATIDGRGIEGINGLLRLNSRMFVGIENSRLADQDVGEIGIDPPVADLVGMSLGVAGDSSSKAHVIELLLIATKAGLDISKAFPIRELGETHTKELIPARKRYDLAAALVPIDTFLKFVLEKELH